jgi:hypothetical protein
VATPSLASLIIQETKAQIYQTAIDVATALGLPVTSWQPGDPTRSFYHLESEVLAKLEEIVVNFIKAGFRDYAEGEWLKVLAKQVLQRRRARGDLRRDRRRPHEHRGRELSRHRAGRSHVPKFDDRQDVQEHDRRIARSRARYDAHGHRRRGRSRLGQLRGRGRDRRARRGAARRHVHEHGRRDRHRRTERRHDAPAVHRQARQPQPERAEGSLLVRRAKLRAHRHDGRDARALVPRLRHGRGDDLPRRSERRRQRTGARTRRDGDRDVRNAAMHHSDGARCDERLGQRHVTSSGSTRA